VNQPSIISSHFRPGRQTGDGSPRCHLKRLADPFPGYCQMRQGLTGQCTLLPR
jgi:hypothetical protein